MRTNKIYGVKCPKCGELHTSDNPVWTIIKCKSCSEMFQAEPRTSPSESR